MASSNKKVFVSGCFDLLHAGHVQFLKLAAQYGDLYVSLGNDENIKQLKGNYPVYSQDERKFIIESIKYVVEAFVAKGMGILDFIEELKAIRPDFFVVNADGHTSEKQKLVESLGVEYIVLEREPAESLPVRSSTAVKNFIKESNYRYDPSKPIAIPYRIDLCGGWLDQPFVSKFHPGSVITFPVFGMNYENTNLEFSIEYAIEFNHRSGMATSTRKSAMELWGNNIPAGEPEKLAKLLFHFNNPPGTQYISGAQDSIGIVVPGIVNSFYNGQYWPEKLEIINDRKKIEFLEKHLCLLPLRNRLSDYDPLGNTNITKEGAEALAHAADNVWQSIENMDLNNLARGVTAGFEAQVEMFPQMVDDHVKEYISESKNKFGDNLLGYKLSGAGGGGYLICVVKEIIPDSIIIKIQTQ